MPTSQRASWPTRHSSWALGTTDQLLSADQYRPLIVAYNNGAAVRLSDIADVTDSVEDVRNAGMVDGSRVGDDRHLSSSPAPILSTRWIG